MPFSGPLLFWLCADIHPADNIGTTACADPDTGSDGYHSGAGPGPCADPGPDSDRYYSGTGSGPCPDRSDPGSGSEFHSDNHYDSCIERGSSGNNLEHDNDNNVDGGYPGLYQLYEQLRCREDCRLCDRTLCCGRRRIFLHAPSSSRN
jgi:hypothetical protein